MCFSSISISILFSFDEVFSACLCTDTVAAFKRGFTLTICFASCSNDRNVWAFAFSLGFLCSNKCKHSQRKRKMCSLFGERLKCNRRRLSAKSREKIVRTKRKSVTKQTEKRLTGDRHRLTECKRAATEKEAKNKFQCTFRWIYEQLAT